MKKYNVLWKTEKDDLFREQMDIRDLPKEGFKFIWHFHKWIVVDIEINFDESTGVVIIEKREA